VSGGNKRALVAAAHGNDVFKGGVGKLLGGFRFVFGQIIIKLRHGFNGFRVNDSGWARSGAEGLDQVSPVDYSKSLRHLTAVGVFNTHE